MRKYWNVFGLMLVMALAMTQSSSATISTTTFHFSGTCTDCSGTATATLLLAGNYTLGTPITTSNFVSFTYNGTNLTGAFTYNTATPGLSVSGSMSNIPGQNTFYIVNNLGVFFTSGLNGGWSVGLTDLGTGGTWTGTGAVSATPAPSTSLLLAMGLMSLLAFRLWRRPRRTP